MKWLISILALCLLAMPAFALSNCDGSGNCYVNASVSGGSSNGSSWTNACPSLTTSACAVNSGTRPATNMTIWVATGSYGAQTLSAADSGVNTITIEAATVANHGTATGWSNGLAGTVTFAAGETTGAVINESTDYWIINGQAVGGCTYPTNNTSCYNIYVHNTQSTTGSSGTDINFSGAHETFEYMNVEGTGNNGGAFPGNATADKCNPSTACGVWYDNAFTNGSSSGSIYIGYCYIHHTGNTQMQVNNGNPDTFTFEYNWMAYNHTGQNGQHDEGFSIAYSDFTARYNVLQDICFNGVIADAFGSTPSFANWLIYRNLIFWDATYAAYNGSYGLATSNWGIVFMDGESITGNLYFAYNTIYNINNSSGVVSSDAITGGNNPYNHGSVTVKIENNLWVGSSCVYAPSGGGSCGQTTYCASNTSATCTRDYNASWADSASPYWQTLQTPAAHDYNVSGSTNPFSNATASTVAGFGLSTPDPFSSHQGTSLGSPYDTDMLGNVAGANGYIDIGALQLLGTSSPAEAPSIGLPWLAEVLK